MEKPDSERERTLLFKNMYLISQLWLSYWHIIYAKLKVENIKEVMVQILSLYRPYIFKKTADKIESFILSL